MSIPNTWDEKTNWTVAKVSCMELAHCSAGTPGVGRRMDRTTSLLSAATAARQAGHNWRAAGRCEGLLTAGGASVQQLPSTFPEDLTLASPPAGSTMCCNRRTDDSLFLPACLQKMSDVPGSYIAGALIPALIITGASGVHPLCLICCRPAFMFLALQSPINKRNILRCAALYLSGSCPCTHTASLQSFQLLQLDHQHACHPCCCSALLL